MIIRHNSGKAFIKINQLDNITHNDINLFQQALDSSNSGIIITDNNLEDNPIIYCNKAFEKITGYTREEIIGHNCRFLQNNDRAQPERNIIKKSVEEEKESRVIIRNYKKNGDLFYNELFVSPVKDRNGKTTHYIGVQNDITHLKEIEHELREEKASVDRKVNDRTKELREKEMFLSSIVQTVRESLLVLDEKFVVLSANTHFFKTFKVSSEDTIGKVLYDLGNNQWDIPQLRELLMKILPTSNPVIDFVVEHDFPHIGRKTMILNAHRIEFDGEYKDRILLAVEDATDRTEIERRKDDFLSIASHELKTPLTSIHGLVQLLQRLPDGNANPRYRGLLEKVAMQVDRLNNLISDLLDTSKIQSGFIESHKEDFHLNDVIQSCVDQMAIAHKNHHIKLDLYTIEDNVCADELQITQVINNLLTNAIKYSPNNMEIAVSVSKVSDYLKVSVKDHGFGISKEDQSKVFQRFYRSGETQKKFPGMGIGLYICKEIIDNHNGSIWIESELGNGSVFNFTLPVKSKS